MNFCDTLLQTNRWNGVKTIPVPFFFLFFFLLWLMMAHGIISHGHSLYPVFLYIHSLEAHNHSPNIITTAKLNRKLTKLTVADNHQKSTTATRAIKQAQRHHWYNTGPHSPTILKNKFDLKTYSSSFQDDSDIQQHYLIWDLILSKNRVYAYSRALLSTFECRHVLFSSIL